MGTSSFISILNQERIYPEDGIMDEKSLVKPYCTRRREIKNRTWKKANIKRKLYKKSKKYKKSKQKKSGPKYQGRSKRFSRTGGRKIRGKWKRKRRRN